MDNFFTSLFSPYGDGWLGTYPSLSGCTSSPLLHVSLCLPDLFLEIQLHAIGFPYEKSTVETEIIAAAKSYTDYHLTDVLNTVHIFINLIPTRAVGCKYCTHPISVEATKAQRG